MRVPKTIISMRMPDHLDDQIRDLVRQRQHRDITAFIVQAVREKLERDAKVAT